MRRSIDQITRKVAFENSRGDDDALITEQPDCLKHTHIVGAQDVHRAHSPYSGLMTTVLLVRHGRSKANTAGVLAGRTAGIDLDETGVEQATTAGVDLKDVQLNALIASPLERTMRTAELINRQRTEALTIRPDDRLLECDYGSWTNRPLSELSDEPLWRVVQDHPSGARFPEGESLAHMQHRAVSSVRFWNDELGDDAVYALVSHGDVIKSILADALGMHLDAFQRIHVDTCSISVIKYSKTRPFIVTMNAHSSRIASLLQPPAHATASADSPDGPDSSDAPVGGGSR